jgi:hypothetical protein
LAAGVVVCTGATAAALGVAAGAAFGAAAGAVFGAAGAAGAAGAEARLGGANGFADGGVGTKRLLLAVPGAAGMYWFAGTGTMGPGGTGTTGSAEAVAPENRANPITLAAKPPASTRHGAAI